MSAHPQVRLVVLTYNGRDHVVRCFDHLHALDWPRDRLELLLVDNGSRDGSSELVSESFPDVRVIRMTRNIGFPANNLALTDLEGCDYVGLVNDDAFVAPDYLTPLVETLEADPELGAACPKMLFDSKFVDLHLETTATRPGRGDPRSLGVRISGLSVRERNVWRRAYVATGGRGRETARSGAYEWTGERAVVQVPIGAGGEMPDDAEILLSAPEPKEVSLGVGNRKVIVPVDAESVWCPAPLSGEPYDVINNAGSIVLADGHGADRGFGEPDGPAFAEASDVFAWCGGAVLLRATYLQDTGLFDERFFLYYEDTDLAWRGKARGWRYRYVPDSVVRHLHATTTVAGSSSFAYFTERNRLLMLLKNAPPSMVREIVGDYIGKTYDAARRDVVAALVQGRRPNSLPVMRRLRALVGFAHLVPHIVLDRSTVRGRRRISDDALLDQLTPV